MTDQNGEDPLSTTTPQNSDDKFFDLYSPDISKGSFPQSPKKEASTPPQDDIPSGLRKRGEKNDDDEEEEESRAEGDGGNPQSPSTLLGRAFSGACWLGKVAYKATMTYMTKSTSATSSASDLTSSSGLVGADASTPPKTPTVPLSVQEREARALRDQINRTILSRSEGAVSAKKFQVTVATWNVAQQVPQDNYDIRDWILGSHLTEQLRRGVDPPVSDFPDVVVVGLQEAEFGGTAILLEVTDASVTWTEAVIDCLNSAVKFRVAYKKIKTLQLVGMSLIVVVRTEHEPFVKNVRSSITRTGMKGVLGNKGSIGCRLTIYGKKLLFVCAHFHPHLENAKTRMKNYHDALKELRIPLPQFADDPFDVMSTFDEAFQFLEQRANRRNGGSASASLSVMPSSNTSRQDRQTQGRSAWTRVGFPFRKADSDEALLREQKVLEAHDYVFFFGDLNYRLHGIKGAALRAELDPATCTQEQRTAVLQKHDELIHGMATTEIFDGFTEPNVTFPPTYKYDIGTDLFDTSKKRRDPAWTDRILYRVAHPSSTTTTSTTTATTTTTTSPFAANALSVLQYDSVRSLSLSDHKPVIARFELTVNAVSAEKVRELMAECRDLWDTEHCSEEGHL